MARRLVIVLPAYLLVSVACYWLAFLLRLDFEFSSEYRRVFLHSLPIVLSAKLLAFQLSGEWRCHLRYYTLRDLWWYAAAVAASAASLLVLNRFDVIGGPYPLPRSVIVIDAALQVLLFGMVRAAPRLYREMLHPAMSSRRRLRTLIYGDGREALDILRTVQSSNRKLVVVGLVSPCPELFGRIAGVPILRSELGWRALVERQRVSRVLVPSAVPGRTIRTIRAECEALGVEVHVIPGVEDIAGGRCSLGTREVSITELLRREPARLNEHEIRKYVAGRRVLVTGAAGSIGSELCRRVLEYHPASLTLLDQSELGIFTIEQEFRAKAGDAVELQPVIADIADRRWIDRVMSEYRPEVVFHAAAYKHVPLMEQNVHAAIHNNLLGTAGMVDLAAKHAVERFVLVSTDKAVRPTSVMGATKFLAERYLQAASQTAATRFITVRFGNVLNSTGSVIPTFRRQIEEGGPVTVTHPEMRRFFMTIPEASQLVLQAGALGESGDVFILEMGEPVRIVDLAKDLIRLSGRRYPEDIDIVFTGTRPGEKLYEELFYSSETGINKVHDKIFWARPEPIDAAEVRADLARLTTLLAAPPADATRALWQIVARHVEKAEQQRESLRSAA